MKKSLWLFFLGLASGLILIFSLVLPKIRPYTYHGTVLQSPQTAPDFKLKTAGGQEVRLQDFEGKLVLLYFGYTFCPDICPATLSDLANALDILGAEAQEVQVIMISVDPERDTPEILAEYVAHFRPSFLGMTGTPEEVAQVAVQYGIFYEAQEGTAASGYLVDHTATVIVINQEGYLKLVFPFGTPPEDIAEDLTHLLQ